MEQSKPFSPPLADFDSVCQTVRAALEPARVHALSILDEKGDVLWLTESSMGPDEHNAARDALNAFAKPNGPMVRTYDLGDAKSAVLLRAVNARRALVGAVMAVVDTRLLKVDEKGTLKLLTPKLQRAVADFAALRSDVGPAPAAARTAAPATTPKPASTPKPAAAPPAARTNSLVALELSLQDAMLALAPDLPRAPPQAGTPVRRPSAAPTRTPAAVTAAPAAAGLAVNPAGAPAAAVARPAARSTAASAAPVASATQAPPPAAIADVPVKRTTPEVTPEIDRLHAALRRSPIALHVQHMIPLTKGGQLQRYEVLLRSKSSIAPNAAPAAMLKAAVENGLGSMIDRRVITELIGWLVHHPQVWKTNAVLFSVNLTTTALHDEHFIKFVELCLAKSALPKAMIAFEIDVASATHLRSRMNGIAEALQRLGCPLILDDFGLRTECFDLLRLPGVRYVKLASDITVKMRSDKLSQAAITAVVQMARVLGMHTVAKRTETSAEREWLTALGVDFIQSNALSPPAPIDTLARKADAPSG